MRAGESSESPLILCHVDMGLCKDSTVETRQDVRVETRGNATAEQWRLDELHRHFALELGASTSLNARGTQLAAFAGVIIGLLGALAKDRDLGCLAWAVLIVAGLVLLIAAAIAVTAVYPQSRWRGHLQQAVLALRGRVEVTANDPHKACPIPEVVDNMLCMVELQRHTNEKKARLMRWAYLTLGVGLAMSAVAVGVLLAAEPEQAAFLSVRRSA